jgi:hypothetical protein
MAASNSSSVISSAKATFLPFLDSASRNTCNKQEISDFLKNSVPVVNKNK